MHRRAGRTGGRPPKLAEDDLEAARALLANPDIGVTQIATVSGSLRRRSIDTSPPRDPRILATFEKVREPSAVVNGSKCLDREFLIS
jgi:hypothetical protein